MSKEPLLSEDSENLNQTSEATLAALTTQITEFVRQSTLDSRCAAKLIKRLKKEAEVIVVNGNSSKTERNRLNKAFSAADSQLREHDANLLVAAVAKLRDAEAHDAEAHDADRDSTGSAHPH